MGASYQYKKRHVDLPGQPYYNYDAVFKGKVISDIDAGLISSRKSAALYNVNRKTIERWRTELACRRQLKLQRIWHLRVHNFRHDRRREIGMIKYRVHH